MRDLPESDQGFTAPGNDQEFYQQVMRDLPKSYYNFTSTLSDLYQQVIRVLQYQEMIKNFTSKQ